MNKTLLESFLQLKAEQYTEPSRSGTPRGEPIGLSKVKYYATLFMLFNGRQKDIAKALGISYGLLRKWNTEEAFRAMVNRHCIEFADFFIKETVKREQEHQAALSEFQRKSIEEMAEKQLPHRIDHGLSDCNKYSPGLLMAITQAVQEYSKKTDIKKKFLEVLSVLATFLTVMQPFLGDEAFALLTKKAAEGMDLRLLSKQMKLGMLEEVKKILLKRDISEEERKRAYYCLERLATVID